MIPVASLSHSVVFEQRWLRKASRAEDFYQAVIFDWLIASNVRRTAEGALSSTY